jgi:hypothetical protein
MLTIDELKDKLRRRLTELDGHATPTDLEDIIEAARELGMTDERIARMVPEVDRAINWEHIRLEKEHAAAQARLEAEAEARRQDEIAAAPEYLDALIAYSLADGIVEAEELRIIFEKARSLEQPVPALAMKIKTLLSRKRFRPYPNADLTADGLHEVLMSTSWYTDKTHPQQQMTEPEAAPAAPQPAPLHILRFSVERPLIGKGQYTKLIWSVSGEGRIHISNLGSTERLSGEQIIRPLETTRYVLTAGEETRTVEVAVKIMSRRKKIWRVILIVLGFLLLYTIAKSAPGPSALPAQPVSDEQSEYGYHGARHCCLPEYSNDLKSDSDAGEVALELVNREWQAG